MVEEFKRPELQYLNRKPKMPYLRKEKSKKSQIRMNFFKVSHSPSIPRKSEAFTKKDFGKGYFIASWAGWTKQALY